jgi:hypothetical protein
VIASEKAAEVDARGQAEQTRHDQAAGPCAVQGAGTPRAWLQQQDRQGRQAGDAQAPEPLEDQTHVSQVRLRATACPTRRCPFALPEYGQLGRRAAKIGRKRPGHSQPLCLGAERRGWSSAAPLLEQQMQARPQGQRAENGRSQPQSQEQVAELC